MCIYNSRALDNAKRRLIKNFVYASSIQFHLYIADWKALHWGLLAVAQGNKRKPFVAYCEPFALRQKWTNVQLIYFVLMMADIFFYIFSVKCDVRLILPVLFCHCSVYGRLQMPFYSRCDVLLHFGAVQINVRDFSSCGFFVLFLHKFRTMNKWAELSKREEMKRK